MRRTLTGAQGRQVFYSAGSSAVCAMMGPIGRGLTASGFCGIASGHPVIAGRTLTLNLLQDVKL